MNNREYISKDDLPIINRILAKGADVRIKRTSFHAIILDENVKVARKKELESPVKR